MHQTANEIARGFPLDAASLSTRRPHRRVILPRDHDRDHDHDGAAAWCRRLDDLAGPFYTCLRSNRKTNEASGAR
jgi:hypothetical protein